MASRSAGLASCRRDLLDHVIALNEHHLKRCFLNTSVTTTKIARIWDSGKKRQAAGRTPYLSAVYRHSSDWGGLHHHYDRAA
jgi:hypothetical protein